MDARRISAIRTVFEKAWDASTAWKAEQWSRDVPSTGQCAVTTVILQKYLGGTILRTTYDNVPHYLLVLPSGEELDITRDQFRPEAARGPSKTVDPHQLSRSTRVRLRILEERVAPALDALMHVRHERTARGGLE